MTHPTDHAAQPITLHDEPGHLIRRAQQIAVSSFHEVHGRHITPIQYAILRTLQLSPGIDQVTLADKIALDTSTAADIAARLDAKGWIVRTAVQGRHQRSLRLTPEGEGVLQDLLPGIDAHYQAMMGSLSPAEQQDFMRLLRKFVHLRESSSGDN